MCLLQCAEDSPDNILLVGEEVVGTRLGVGTIRRQARQPKGELMLLSRNAGIRWVIDQMTSGRGWWAVSTRNWGRPLRSGKVALLMSIPML